MRKKLVMLRTLLSLVERWGQDDMTWFKKESNRNSGRERDAIF